MNRRRPECRATVHGDEFHCGNCGLVWDTNDSDPPECGQADRVNLAQRLLKKLDANKYTLILEAGRTEMVFRAEWMAKVALEKAIEGYLRGSYDFEPVLIDPRGQEVQL